MKKFSQILLIFGLISFSILVRAVEPTTWEEIRDKTWQTGDTLTAQNFDIVVQKIAEFNGINNFLGIFNIVVDKVKEMEEKQNEVKLALSLRGDRHIAEGGLAIMGFDKIFVNSGFANESSIKAGTIVIPKSGLYHIDASFTTECWYNGGTYDDVYMHFYKNNEHQFYIWKGEESSAGRGNASAAAILQLQTGDILKFYSSADAGYKRDIQNYFVSIFEL